MLLILTCEDDIHTDALIRELGRCAPEFPIVRINSDRLPTNADYCFNWKSDGSFASRYISMRDGNVSADSPTVIWYRKPEIPLPHPDLADYSAKECSRQEWREFLQAFHGYFPEAKWVNDYWAMQRSAIKPFQIAHARSVGLSIPETVITNDPVFRAGWVWRGLSIPETVITNDPQELKRFVNSHPSSIIKPLYFSGYRDGTAQFACYTNVLPPEDVLTLEDGQLDYAPCIVQRRIEKAEELRVTVVGDEVFACAIETPAESAQRIDWRIDNPEELPHRLVNIPEFISRQLKTMLRRMNLNFGAFDIIRESNGSYYFIEVNPNGQYYWIELLTKAPITAAIARLILRLHRQS